MFYQQVLRRLSLLHSSQLARNTRLQIKNTPGPLQISAIQRPLLRTAHEVPTYEGRRTLCTSPQLHRQAGEKDVASRQAQVRKDDAIPFLHSKAHKFKVDDAYSVDTPKDRSRQRYALPLGVSMFVTIIYFGFVRGYSAKDRSIVGFLTADIGDKLPDDVREKIYSEVNPSNQTLTVSDDSTASK